MIYFDNAASSYPKPDSVYDTVLDTMKNIGANPGRSGHAMAIELGRKIFKTRLLIMELINASSYEEIIFTKNGTESLNLGILGLLKSGDHVITTTNEHNSVLRPLIYLRDKNIIEVTIIESDKKGYIDNNQIENSIKDNTRLIIVNHISNVIGSITDIKGIGRIARKNNILFFVDAAQSIGSFNIDVEDMNIDLLAFPGHKGLYGPQGTGVLYIRNGIEIDSIIYGGTGSVSESMIQPDFLPDKLESGTLNSPGILGLAQGIKFVKDIGIDRIKKKEADLSNYFIEEIEKIDGIKIYGPSKFTERGAVVSINIKDIGSSDISRRLDEDYNIATRPSLHCAPLVHRTIGTMDQGTVRFSFSYFNTDKEIEEAIKAIKEISHLY